jgi:hypothetical protein
MLRNSFLKQLLLTFFGLNCLCFFLQAQSQGDFGTKERITNGLEGTIYGLSPDTRSLPDFDTIQPLGKIYAKELNIPGRSWTEGFPGVTDRFEWFGIEYRGMFTVKTPGLYTFSLLSDDGSKLFIDDKLVIDNDGVHGPVQRAGDIDLDKSKHEIKIRYFQGPRTQIALQLRVKLGNGVEEVFPGNNFILTTSGNATSFIGSYIFWAIITILILLLLIWIWYRRKKRTVTKA